MEAATDDQEISFGVQANVPVAEVARVAQAAEHAGVERFLVADHPGSVPDPFIALAVAAAATERIGLGTYVLNAGIREPWQAATAALSLNDLSDGRFTLGVGAGHTPAEWGLAGLNQPLPAGRVARLQEFVQLTAALLQGGPVSFQGDHFSCEYSRHEVRPHQLPILIGGNGPHVLALAARYAQTISITGFGATQADGHTHTVRWSEEDVAHSVALINSAAQAHRTAPGLEVLVQHVELSEHREAAARNATGGDDPWLNLEIALNTPFLLFGTPEQIAHQLHYWRKVHGITRFVVRHDAIDAISQILRVLR